MVVSAEGTWGSIGGGNVEAAAVNRARALLAEFATEPTTFTANLSDKTPVEHGVQCCGGEVTVLLDPLAVRPAVAIFGVGHVGLQPSWPAVVHRSTPGRTARRCRLLTAAAANPPPFQCCRAGARELRPAPVLV
jgi:xanthine/CO dehydrogenase XdhC/CoxF family maturation factor